MSSYSFENLSSVSGRAITLDSASMTMRARFFLPKFMDLHTGTKLTQTWTVLFILTVLIVSGSVPTAQAQQSDSARVSLLTIYPGDAIYALWGHSALRVWDPVTGTDISYNYGTFDFRSPVSFIARFAYGKLDYQLSLNYSQSLLDHSWLAQERGVVEQELNLTRKETRALHNYLSINALPENRTYRYDFLYDNCATRILDALEHAVQSPLADAPSVEDITFRELIRPYLRTRPGLDVAINLAMGLPVDQPASRRQRSFLPIELQQILHTAQTPTGTPLVARTDTLFGRPTSPQSREAMSLPTGIGWLIFLTCVLISVQDRNRPRRRLFDFVLFAGVSLIGLILAFFWLLSLHEITRPNLHLLWAWPVHIIPLFFSQKSWTNFYWWIAVGAAATFVLASSASWETQSLPAITLPLSLAVMLRGMILTAVPRTGFEPVLPA